LESLLNAFRGLGPGRILSLFLGLAILIAVGSYSVTQVSQPGMALLYGGLTSQETSELAEFLGTQGIAYEQRGEGSIYVPSDKVGQLRLQAAGQGLVGGSISGYELFDESSTFGTTNFVQNINAKRALEGELVRTISSLPSVQTARVHLVLPKQNLFSRESTQPSAAVALNLGSRQLTPDQVGSIAGLVAAAVPGLALTHVTIIDQRGSMLFNGAEQGTSSGSLTKHASEIENKLEQEVATLLERVTGPGQVAVRISAKLSSQNVTEMSEIFDPTQQVVRSEQVIESTSNSSSGGSGIPVGVAGNIPGGEGAAGGGGGASGAEARTETTTNYEITKTVRNLTKSGGEIEKLSIAVLLGGKVTESEDGTRTTTPFSDEEKTNMERLAKSAVGFSAERGDSFEMADLPFTQLAELTSGEAEPFVTTSQILEIAKLTLLVMGLIVVAIFVVKPALSVLQQSMGAAAPSSLPGLSSPSLNLGGGEGEAPGISGGGPAGAIDSAKFTVKQRESAAKKAAEVVDQMPEESLSVVRTWMAGSNPSDNQD